MLSVQILVSLFFIHQICLVLYRVFFSPLAGFPGPKIAAATGWYETYFAVVRGGRFLWEIERMHQKYGPIMRINPFEIHINDASFYNTLYAGPTNKRNKYSWFINVGAPNSSFSTAEYNHHRVRRAIISPYLSKQAIRNYEPIMREKLSALCRHLDISMNTGVDLELHTCFVAYAVDVVSHILYGASGCVGLLAAGKLDDKWKTGITGAFGWILRARHFPFLVALFRHLPLWLCASVAPNCQDMALTEKHMSMKAFDGFAEPKAPNNAEDDGISVKILKDEKIPVTERQFPRLIDDAKFLMEAGVDAPSQVLAITTFYILNEAPVYRKLQEELANAMPDPMQVPSLSLLERLPYLTAVIKEGLRISSIVTSRLPRIAPDEAMVYQGWHIPAGTPVSMSTYLIHRNPEIFPDPSSFKPERWMEQTAELDLDKCPMPFSRGSQACLGPSMTYAWSYLAFATIFRRYEMTLFKTTEVNVKTVRDCFNAQTMPGYNNIRVKVLKAV